MSDINSQNQNNIIPSLKEHSIGTKTSLEQINKILQEIHKNMLKESSSKNDMKSIQLNDKEGTTEKNKDNIEDTKKENILEKKLKKQTKMKRKQL